MEILINKNCIKVQSLIITDSNEMLTLIKYIRVRNGEVGVSGSNPLRRLYKSTNLKESLLIKERLFFALK